MSLIHAFLVITLRASQIVSGLALTIFGGVVGLSSYLGNDLGLADVPASHQLHELDVFRAEGPRRRRPDRLRPVVARLPLVGGASPSPSTSPGRGPV